MKQQKIFLIQFIFCLVLIFTSCQKKHHYYVALGDSVASGYGLNSPEDSYPSIFFNLLKNNRQVSNYENMAVNGFTTTMLLDFLVSIDIEKKHIIEQARVITVNIGGNNLLAPYVNYIANLQVVSGAEYLTLGAESLATGTRNIFTGVFEAITNYISGSDEIDNSSTTNIKHGINDMKKGADNIITGTRKIISGSPDAFSTFNGFFSPELKADLENGVSSFSVEFLEIIAWMKKTSPKSIIIVNTIYNPFPHEVLGTSLEFSIAVDNYIQSMNNIIIQESRRGYLVTDTYTHLSNIDMMRFNIKPTARNFSLDIIHPNAASHNLIAQLNYETYMQRRKNKLQQFFQVR